MADERYSTESNGRAGAGGVQTRGKSLLKGKKNQNHLQMWLKLK